VSSPVTLVASLGVRLGYHWCLVYVTGTVASLTIRLCDRKVTAKLRLLLRYQESRIGNCLIAVGADCSKTPLCVGQWSVAPLLRPSERLVDGVFSCSFCYMPMETHRSRKETGRLSSSFVESCVAFGVVLSSTDVGVGPIDETAVGLTCRRP